MKNRLQILFIILIMLGVLVSCSSCSPTYIMRGAYEEAKILARRQDIDRILHDRSASDDELRKLQLVKDARLFTLTMGLTPRNSFTKYTRIDKDVLTWVVMGCRPDSFIIRGWWYPIVGSLPYKGYFDRSDADKEALDLQSEGYETWVRGSEAFSTLGWFNDPVLTPTLKQPEYRIANTVIHETTHATVWIPNNVPFNESLANFVGTQGAVEFFAQALKTCSADAACVERQQSLLRAAQRSKEAGFQIAGAVEHLYQDLNLLYNSSSSHAEKLARRNEIFKKHIDPLHAAYPRMEALQSINNAEIMQLVIYMTSIADFEKLFQALNQDWKAFFDKMREIAKKSGADATRDPFAELRAMTPP